MVIGKQLSIISIIVNLINASGIPHESSCDGYYTDQDVFCELEWDCCGEITYESESRHVCLDKDIDIWIDYSN